MDSSGPRGAGQQNPLTDLPAHGPPTNGQSEGQGNITPSPISVGNRKKYDIIILSGMSPVKPDIGAFPMPRSPVTAWFRPKRFGYGWSPASWEGWAITGLAALAIVAVAGLLN